jgi:hypothetical protein
MYSGGCFVGLPICLEEPLDSIFTWFAVSWACTKQHEPHRPTPTRHSPPSYRHHPHPNILPFLSSPTHPRNTFRVHQQRRPLIDAPSSHRCLYFGCIPSSFILVFFYNLACAFTFGLQNDEYCDWSLKIDQKSQSHRHTAPMSTNVFIYAQRAMLVLFALSNHIQLAIGLVGLPNLEFNAAIGQKALASSYFNFDLNPLLDTKYVPGVAYVSLLNVITLI